MADFGQKGKITERINKPSVLVRLSDGQFLSYKLTVQGGTPMFAFSCQHPPARFSARDLDGGNPRQDYEWTWCENGPGEADDDDDQYVIPMSFIHAVKYTLLVRLHANDGSPLKTIKDVDYESQSSLDNFTARLSVLTV